MKPVLLDASVIVALLDIRQRHNRACSDAVAENPAQLVTCEAVIAESCYLLRSVRGAKEAILENVATGVFQIPMRLTEAAADVKRILNKYRDHDVDLADACLVQLATTLNTGEILTLDSDFQFYRWGANKPFHSLIPKE